MIHGLKTAVRLAHDVRYEDAGQLREIAAGTALDWLQIICLFTHAPLTLNPGGLYEVGTSFTFIWAGKHSLALQPGVVLEVATLTHEGTCIVVPLSELAAPVTGASGHTQWDQRVCILAWEQAKIAARYEVTEPLVIDGNTP